MYIRDDRKRIGDLGTVMLINNQLIWSRINKKVPNEIPFYLF